MGVGFDRTGAQGTEPGVPCNPFVSLVSLASGAPLSSVRPGYIVTREGVHLGMSAERTRGFAFIKLASNPASRPGVPEWSATSMAVSVDGVTGNGTVLVDTGINYMFCRRPTERGWSAAGARRRAAGSPCLCPTSATRSRTTMALPSAPAAIPCIRNASRSCTTVAYS